MTQLFALEFNDSVVQPRYGAKQELQAAEVVVERQPKMDASSGATATLEDRTHHLVAVELSQVGRSLRVPRLPVPRLYPLALHHELST